MLTVGFQLPIQKGDGEVFGPEVQAPPVTRREIRASKRWWDITANPDVIADRMIERVGSYIQQFVLGQRQNANLASTQMYRRLFKIGNSIEVEYTNRAGYETISIIVYPESYPVVGEKRTEDVTFGKSFIVSSGFSGKAYNNPFDPFGACGVYKKPFIPGPGSRWYWECELVELPREPNKEKVYARGGVDDGTYSEDPLSYTSPSQYRVKSNSDLATYRTPVVGVAIYLPPSYPPNYQKTPEQEKEDNSNYIQGSMFGTQNCAAVAPLSAIVGQAVRVTKTGYQTTKYKGYYYVDFGDGGGAPDEEQFIVGPNLVTGTWGNGDPDPPSRYWGVNEKVGNGGRVFLSALPNQYAPISGPPPSLGSLDLGQGILWEWPNGSGVLWKIVGDVGGRTFDTLYNIDGTSAGTYHGPLVTYYDQDQPGDDNTELHTFYETRYYGDLFNTSDNPYHTPEDDNGHTNSIAVPLGPMRFGNVSWAFQGNPGTSGQFLKSIFPKAGALPDRSQDPPDQHQSSYYTSLGTVNPGDVICVAVDLSGNPDNGEWGVWFSKNATPNVRRAPDAVLPGLPDFFDEFPGAGYAAFCQFFVPGLKEGPYASQMPPQSPDALEYPPMRFKAVMRMSGGKFDPPPGYKTAIDQTLTIPT